MTDFYRTHPTPATAADPPGRRLTTRQREVIVLLAEGLNAPAIAARLHIAESTATAHIQAVLQRLGATNRAHAVALAFRAGVLQ